MVEAAAQLSKVAYKFVQTYKNAKKEMSVIARELTQFSGSLQTLVDVINNCSPICKPEFFSSLQSILLSYRQVETELKSLIVDNGGTLLKPRWCMRKPKAKKLIKQIDAIKAALNLELNVLQFARSEMFQT